MNKQIMKAAGFGKQVEDVKAHKCPLCGRTINVDEFRDDLSRKEYRISGLCQMCQDEVFGGDDE